uniref:Uncharacterized protein n=1 Tax=Archaeoglobus fulgidus TaxID=2234 RepID=A0A7C3REN7_ARCFL
MIEFKVAKAFCLLSFVIFLFVGFYFFLFPKSLEIVILETGKLLKVERGDEINFWRSLTFAYMMTIAFLALLIASNVTIYWRFLIVLFIAKVSSSSAALTFFLSGGGFYSLVITFVDFPLALFFIGLYLWIWKNRIMG